VHYIELFAGCGGLSLGLQSVGFKLVMANELSPMAAESYAYNFFNEDLSLEAQRKTPELKKTLWLSSHHPLEKLKSRLREDPREFPLTGEGQCDIKADGSNLSGGLVVGSIVELNKWLVQKPKVAAELKTGFGNGGVDLISGGPPCQSFSMAGLRELDSDKNSLPWEFAKFAQTVQPKLVLLENVTGILRPFKDQVGKSFYAWFELAKAFAAIGYVPLCLHVNAKVAGVPQNRPRFILLGVRADIFKQLAPTFNAAEKLLFEQPLEFFQKTKTAADVGLEALMYRDVSNPDDLAIFNSSFLKSIVVSANNYVTVGDAIDDLRHNGAEQSPFSVRLLKTFSKVLPKRKMQNHVRRTNNALVIRRFRLYQVLQLVENDTRKNVLGVLKGKTHELSDGDWKQLRWFDYLIESGRFVRFDKKREFLSFLDRHTTKKQTQKALLANQPAPAALSIPDDACHYHRDEPRTLTVREMARLQSFPDNFVFRSKITTGGKMRRFEVPQYTQVGNAVPPLLGRALGLAAADLLARLKNR
jgi:DNA (cytosine-5)-methyltransferase 1